MPPRKSTPLAADAATTSWASLGALGRATVVIAVAAIVAYVGVALARMRYPFELEWMEGAGLQSLERLVHGQPLYVAPSLDFTPFIYPPLYFQVSAWIAHVTGSGFLTLRLVSFLASLGVIALVYRYVRDTPSSRVAGLIAAGAFAATYRLGGAWLDLGRVDSMFLLLLLGAVTVLRRDASAWRGGAIAGVLVVLAALTKQSALFVAAPVALAVLLTDARRGAAFVAAGAGVLGGAYVVLQAASHGWFRYYVFDLPRDHPIIPKLLRDFWISDLLGPLGIALVLGAASFFVAPVRPRVRRVAIDVAFAVGLIGTAYATRVRVGSFVNVVLPAYLAAALLLGLGLAALERHRDPAAPAPRLAERFVLLLVFAQFGLLAYVPWRLVPTARDRAAGEQIVESLRRVNGDVWVPRHDYLAVMAGKPWHAHELALQDVLRPAASAQHAELLAAIQRAASERRFAVLVLDDATWVQGQFAPYDTLVARMFQPSETDLFWPSTGFVTRPDFVWMPKGAAAPGGGGS